jgi:ribosomal protein S18 acetylase RimI-like enzyme
LVADSIAQQRQQAAMSLIFHPLPLAGLLAVLAAIYRYAWAHHDHNHHHDPGTAMLLASGAVTSYLLAIRLATSGYLRAAEALSWDFLADNDVVIGTRFGGEVIGALILRLERPGSSNPHISSPLSATTSTTAYSHSRTSSICSSSSSTTSSSPSTSNHHNHSNHSNHSNRRKPHSRQNSRRGGGKGVIRAWTTKLRYRGRGVGGDMLREAVRLTRERRGRDAQVGFAREHANSVAVLPELFNRGLRQREMRAARALEAVLAACEGGRRR